ncbi:succinyltransferase [Corynebacterium ulcerans]|uniref:2,3,4,5-tetrahydropyridine-2,6-dicarboxylate N-succinyltransferase n=1 Tax=Corynebacterium ulcerans TaxID=65058 RepID=A0ABD7MSH1_CORUL|nr:DapH/DapD/GlmU-related protein [Corynebacterium ulcerans]MBH5298664.1 succinyltransferase [Corynebacterium ulcerans]MBH5301923.1 succinyltransferase [Corynebacterium ulcerans]NOL58511.1 succinyltransferase [Corynebacterium ulcerans]NOL61734.1 succinyltransferase [Corynebacterium ulcerans]NOM02361.1 succinyltransferase [Corynebacterium ulcerans]
MIHHGADATGIANIAMDGTVLDTWYPAPRLTSSPMHPTGTTRLGAHHISPKLLNLVRIDEDRRVEQIAVHTTIADLSSPPIDAHDVYLRLHLLSHRIVRPHDINMDNATDLLAIVAWTNKGPCLPDDFENVRTSLRSRGLIHVYGIDKLPRMVDYVVPSGIEITEAERVRLGAHLAPGTKVLREGYVSYNAGTLGPGRVEGRLYAGTVVGNDLDLGISASLVPDKSTKRLRVGNNCKLGLGAAVIGIDLGDNVTICNNIVLDPATQIYDASSQQRCIAESLRGKSNFCVQMEFGHPEPVIHSFS